MSSIGDITLLAGGFDFSEENVWKYFNPATSKKKHAVFSENKK